MDPLTLDAERCYRAVASRDTRFDGWFVVGVTSTGIYCRPGCPAPVRPKRQNVRFFATSAAAQGAGFRSCKRCAPDASPGSPAWNVRTDLAARAMRLIADGVVDRDGVPGLADRLAVSQRHLHRVLTAELGAGPVALARAQRAQTARVLIETTGMPFSAVAFAAGFSSIRQFNDTVREVFDRTPTDLRRRRPRTGAGGAAPVTLRLPYRPPLDVTGLLDWLEARAIPAVEERDGGTFRRVVRLPRGAGLVELTPGDGAVRCTLRLEDLGDLAAAVARCRRLLDLDADPVAIAEALGDEPALRPVLARRPGRRSPGAVDGAELAIRAVLGQQVSVAAARALAGRLVELVDDRSPIALGGLTHRFPAPAAIAEADLNRLGMPTSRVRTVREVAAALADGVVELQPGADRAEVRARMLAIAGIGPWTADYIVLRALSDPDVLLPTDVAVRRGAAGLGLPSDAVDLERLAERWRPWRSYATHLLWTAA